MRKAVMTNAEIEAFISVYENKNISKAAGTLFISQSSLSTKIKALEKEIGCPLFQRSKGSRVLSPTDSGEKFYALAVRYNDIVRQMLSLGPKSAPEKLRVASLNSIGTYLFTPVYERFMLKSPDTILEIQDMETNMAYINLENGLTDMAFTTNCRPSKKIIANPAFSEPMVFVCSKSAAYPKIVGVSDLDTKNEIYINWTTDFGVWHKTIFGEDASLHLKLEIMSHLQYFVMKNSSWAIVPASVAYGLTNNGDITKRQMSFDVPRRITNCLYLPTPSKEAVVSCFLSCLREVLLAMCGNEIEVYL